MAKAKHAKVSAVADGPDTDLVRPSDWNADHSIEMDGPGIIGRTDSGAGVVSELSASDTRTFLGLGTAATQNTGTSGANVPLLNAANTFGATQAFVVGGAADGSAVLVQQNAAAGTMIERTTSAVNIAIAYKGTSGTVYAGQGAANTFAIDGDNALSTSPWMSVGASGATWNVNVTTQGATPLHWVKSTSASTTSVAQTHGGTLYTAVGTNTSNKYTPGVLFGSTDTDLTTTNPKIGAAIVGYATEAYASDTSGGMGIEIFTTANNPGAAGNLVSIGTFATTGYVINSDYFWLKVAGGTGVAWNSNDVLRVGKATGDAWVGVAVENTATCGYLFGDTDARNAGEISYNHSTNTFSWRVNASPAVMTLTSTTLSVNGVAVSVTGHTHTASQITDSTTAGRALLTAADASAQRTSLGLGTAATKNIHVGTTAPVSPAVGDLWVDTN